MTRVSWKIAAWASAAALALIAAAIAVPRTLDWDVHANHFPPLHAEWLPRVGLGLPLAIVLGIAAVLFAQRLSERLRWPLLMACVFGAALAWLLSLALVDGLDGIGTILNHQYEYLDTARDVVDFGATLREYIERIPLEHPDNWPVHIAGHPPGALLFFYLLVRMGLGSGLAAGLVVTVIGATIPVAVLATVRLLGAETLARRAAPFVVFTPAAIWVAVSGDGMFAAVAAWGMWALAMACTAKRRGVPAPLALVWAVLAGLLLGYCVMLSYGLPLLGVMAIVILLLTRAWWVLPVAVVSALAVVLAFAANGFAWWEAFPVLQQRYWDGIASRRPPEYWMWGNIAAFAISAGPVVAASLTGAAARLRRPPAERDQTDQATGNAVAVIVSLALAGWLMVVMADASNMSRAEVERIWLPFAPWAILGASLFGARTRRTMLAGQIAFAIITQCLLSTGW